MNYWFLYNLSDGSIYGAPYLGYAEEWTNIPDGCGVLGAIAELDATDDIKKAYSNPLAYKVVDEKIVVNANYAPPQPAPQPPSQESRLEAVESAIATLMGV